MGSEDSPSRPLEADVLECDLTDRSPGPDGGTSVEAEARAVCEGEVAVELGERKSKSAMRPRTRNLHCVPERTSCKLGVS